MDLHLDGPYCTAAESREIARLTLNGHADGANAFIAFKQTLKQIRRLPEIDWKES